MNRTTGHRLTEYSMLLVAVIMGGLVTTFMPPEQRSGIAIQAGESSINHVSTEIPTYDTVGSEVDARRLSEIAAMC
jgi:hypothetical protein